MITIAEAIALTTVIMGIMSVLVSIITAFSAASRNSVETLESIVDKLEKQGEKLIKELSEVKDENGKLRTDFEKILQENKELWAWAKRLIKQLEEAGLKPEPFRDHGDKEK